mmetsp:Transcript_1188/g.3194  ORF Transcript_1188/g.3194 Transcript_1188/m.3194 type:complete len:219 (-) Transcript_1188:538-1194(-)
MQVQELDELVHERPRRPQQSLDVVVPRTLHPERPRPPRLGQGKEKLLSMPEGDHLILRPMHYENRTAYVGGVINIRELVPRHGESKVECHPVRAKERALEYDPRHRPTLPRRLRREVAAGPRPKRPTVEHDLLRLQPSHFEQVPVRSLDVSVAPRLVRGAVGFTVTRVVVRHDVHPKHSRQVVEPVVDHPKILRVAVREQDGHPRVGPLDVEGGYSPA